MNFAHQVWGDLDPGGTRQIVDEEGQIGGGTHYAIVLDYFRVAPMVEEGRHAADGVDADAGRMFAEAGGAGSGGGPHAGPDVELQDFAKGLFVECARRVHGGDGSWKYALKLAHSVSPYGVFAPGQGPGGICGNSRRPVLTW